MKESITEFSGRNRFLSNFYTPAPVYILVGLKWAKCPDVEHGYQASKTLDIVKRKQIIAAPTPAYAKSMGKHVKRVSYWEEVKLVVMLELLRQKYSRAKFREKLLLTDDAKLIEGNWWHDNFWGVCSCDNCHRKIGDGAENWLGRLTMRVRKDLQ